MCIRDRSKTGRHCPKRARGWLKVFRWFVFAGKAPPYRSSGALHDVFREGRAHDPPRHERGHAEGHGVQTHRQPPGLCGRRGGQPGARTALHAQHVS
eukprot:3317994-Alexandrium_andersonii.AAC.1